MHQTSTPIDQIDQLFAIHQQSLVLNAQWPSILLMFYQNEWFNQALQRVCRVTLKKRSLPIALLDDLKQEAWLVLANSFQKNPDLRFNRDRGNYQTYLMGILFRCCSVGVRKLHSPIPTSDQEFDHPYYNQWEHDQELMDLRQSIRRLNEPFRSTIGQLCAGWTVEEIARKRKRNVRTIYRWVNLGTEQLKDLCVPVD